MAERIGARIELEGEREFKQAVTGCNTTLKTLRSEMALVSAESEGQANALEALRRKHEVLERTLDAQKQKQQEIERALQHAKESYDQVGVDLDSYRNKLKSASEALDAMRSSGTASEAALAKQEKVVQELGRTVEDGEKKYRTAGNRVSEWTQQLNTAEAQIVKTSRELETNARYMQEAENASDQCATSIDQFGKAVKSAKEETVDIGETIEKSLIKNLTDSAFDKIKEIAASSLELEDAQRQLQASTGATNAQMKQYSEVMERIYASNFGESFEDVAEASGLIVQTLGQMDPSALEETAKSAITLRDTFGMEYQEQLRAVKSLMTNFGISGKQAYNLIVQGAQQGLNKNDDLLDTINEYSVHYKRMGVSAEGFFNSLVNGTEAGTFSVDKLGDAYKEFNIRVQDTATTTTEGFELLGMNADQMRQKFAAGGETARNATREVLDALYSLDDMVIQNQAGVDLFGTMWEDLGASGVKALMDVNGEISMTKNAMEELQEIKYDSTTNQIEEIGRRFQTEILQPILNTALPLAEKGLGLIADHMDAVAAVTKIAGSAFLAYEVGVKAAAIAQKALNLELNANAIGLVVSGVVAAGAAFAALISKARETSEEVQRLNERNQKVIESAHEVAEATGKLTESFEDTTMQAAAQGEYVEELADKIQTLAEKQRLSSEEQAVMQEYITELNAIVPELNLAYNEQTNQLSMTNEEMDRYLENAQRQVEIEAAQEIMLETARQKRDLKMEEIKLNMELEDTQKQLNEIEAEYQKQLEEDSLAVDKNREMRDALRGVYDDTKRALDENNSAMEEVMKTEEMQKEYFESLGLSQEEITGAVQRNTEAQIENSTALQGNAEAQGAAAAALSENAQSVAETYSGMQEKIAGVLESQMNMFEEFKQETALSTDEMLANMQSQVDGVTEWANNLTALATREGTKINEDLLRYLEELGPKGAGYVQTFVNMSDEELKKANGLWMKSMDMKSGTDKSVKDMLTTYTTALNGGKDAVKDAMAEVGANSIEGLVQAMEDGEAKIEEAGEETGESLLRGTKETMQINSPSRAMREIGEYSIEGLIEGMKGRESQVRSAAKSIADILISDMQTGLDSKRFSQIGTEIASGIETGLETRQKTLQEAGKTAAEAVYKSLSGELKAAGFTDEGKGIASRLADGIKDGKSTAVSAAKSLASSVGTEAKKAPSLYSTGQNLAYGMANGIKNGQSAVLNAVTALCSAAVKKAKKELKISSPSKVFEEIGAFTAQGFGSGYEREIVDVNQMIADTMQYAAPGTQNGENRAAAGAEERITVELPIYVGEQYTRTEIVEIALNGIANRQSSVRAMRGEAVYV